MLAERGRVPGPESLALVRPSLVRPGLLPLPLPLLPLPPLARLSRLGQRKLEWPGLAGQADPSPAAACNVPTGRMVNNKPLDSGGVGGRAAHGRRSWNERAAARGGRGIDRMFSSLSLLPLITTFAAANCLTGSSFLLSRNALLLLLLLQPAPELGH